MKYVFKSIVQHEGTGLLTADAARTIHDDIMVLFILHHIHYHGQLLTKSITWYLYCFFKMPHFIFIMIAHVNNNGLFFLQHVIHLLCIYISTFIFHAEVRIMYAIGHDLITYFYFQHPKRSAVIIDRDIQPDPMEWSYRKYH